METCVSKLTNRLGGGTQGRVLWNNTHLDKHHTNIPKCKADLVSLSVSLQSSHPQT